MEIYRQVPEIKFTGTKNAISFTDLEMIALDNIMTAAQQHFEAAHNKYPEDKASIRLINKWHLNT